MCYTFQSWEKIYYPLKKLEVYDIKIIFENGKVQLFNEKNLIGVRFGVRNGLYEISFRAIQRKCLNIEVEDEKAKLT